MLSSSPPKRHGISGQTLRQYIPLALVLVPACVGFAYIWYLSVESFPPEIVRYVPVAWFFATLIGIALAIEALIQHRRRILNGIVVLAGVPLLVVAAIYAFAAMIGG